MHSTQRRLVEAATQAERNLTVASERCTVARIAQRQVSLHLLGQRGQQLTTLLLLLCVALVVVCAVAKRSLLLVEVASRRRVLVTAATATTTNGDDGRRGSLVRLRGEATADRDLVVHVVLDDGRDARVVAAADLKVAAVVAGRRRHRGNAEAVHDLIDVEVERVVARRLVTRPHQKTTIAHL